ncbi:MAG: NAD(P)H-dependent oxidoreductase, partial [Rhizomicrobium sp.]
MHIFAISGSLRAESANTALLRAAKRAAPEGVTIDLLNALELIPPFNPDREMEAVPVSVAELR